MSVPRVTVLAFAVALTASLVGVSVGHADDVDPCRARTDEALGAAYDGHLTQARGLLQDVVVDSPGCAAAHAALATLGHETGLIEHPEYHESRAIALAPRDADVIGMLAMSRMARGDADAARRLAALAVELDCTHPWGRAVSGIFRMTDGEIAAGLDDVQAAHADAPRDPWIFSLLAIATSSASGLAAGSDL